MWLISLAVDWIYILEKCGLLIVNVWTNISNYLFNYLPNYRHLLQIRLLKSISFFLFQSFMFITVLHLVFMHWPKTFEINLLKNNRLHVNLCFDCYLILNAMQDNPVWNSDIFVFIKNVIYHILEGMWYITIRKEYAAQNSEPKTLDKVSLKNPVPKTVFSQMG